MDIIGFIIGFVIFVTGLASGGLIILALWLHEPGGVLVVMRWLMPYRGLGE